MANGVSAHMDPKFWKDPETFKPERFLAEDQTIIGSERVIAFGLGRPISNGYQSINQSMNFV